MPQAVYVIWAILLVVVILANTGHIEALNNSITTATTILQVAGEINSKAETVKKTLSSRTTN